MTHISDVIAFLDRFAPPHLAADWDNTGLLLGDPAWPANKVMTCLTLTPDVAEEAVSGEADLIVSHHPILFKGTKKLTTSTAEGATVLKLTRAGVAVYSPHTSFDNCEGGINDTLARRFDLHNVKPLRAKDGKRECKLVAFVPDPDLKKVSDAVFAAGGGVIGKYEQCSYRLHGTGTFFGTDSTNPTVGERGRREEVSEWRLEVVVPESKVEAMVTALRAAHSYEEPAFDVYPLRPNRSGGDGRIGELAEPLPLEEFAARVKEACSATAVQFVGELPKLVSRVAVACGAAGEFLTDAIRAKADVFVTGEVRFHDCLTARAAGVGLVLTGHYASERPAVEMLADRLKTEFPDLSTWASQREHDPLVTI